MKKGFTLVEILVAVLIMGILVTMAVPQYEKAVEKSRMAEVRTVLKRLYDAKMRVLNNMDKETYNTTSPLFGLENLDFTIACNASTTSNGHQMTCSTKDFAYVINPSGTGNENFVCAVRNKGDYKGVNFIYKGDEVAVGTSNFFGTANFLCNEGVVAGRCDVYGMASTGSTAFCSVPN